MRCRGLERKIGRKTGRREHEDSEEYTRCVNAIERGGFGHSLWRVANSRWYPSSWMAAPSQEERAEVPNISLGDIVEVKLEDPDGSETWYRAVVTDFDRSTEEVDEENAVEFEVLYEGDGADYAVPYGLDLRKDELRVIDIVVPEGVDGEAYVSALRSLRRVSSLRLFVCVFCSCETFTSTNVAVSSSFVFRR